MVNVREVTGTRAVAIARLIFVAVMFLLTFADVLTRT